MSALMGKMMKVVECLQRCDTHHENREAWHKQYGAEWKKVYNDVLVKRSNDAVVKKRFNVLEISQKAAKRRDIELNKADACFQKRCKATVRDYFVTRLKVATTEKERAEAKKGLNDPNLKSAMKM